MFSIVKQIKQVIQKVNKNKPYLQTPNIQQTYNIYLLEDIQFWIMVYGVNLH
jgi:hypothetical protein